MPSDLRITDLRVAVIGKAPMLDPIIRIDTNQGISGYGEVRDGASKTYALMLKNRLIGENPCNVDKVFRKIKQFGGHARQGGGVCAVEMACWDLAGKAFGVPVYQMLGGQFRNRIRIYADTPEVPRTGDVLKDAERQAEKLKGRMDMGITFLKCDVGIDVVESVPGTLSIPLGQTAEERAMIMHPFTGIELTEKGASLMADYVGRMREIIGMDVPLATDHFGHIGVNSCIRLAQGDGEAQPRLDGGHGPLAAAEPDEDDQGRGRRADPDRRGHLPEGGLHQADRLRRGRHDPPRPRDLRRHPRDEEDRRLRDGATASAWRCTSPARRSRSWRTSTAPRRRRTSSPSSTTRSTCRGGATSSRPRVTLDKGFAVVPDRPGLGVEPNPEVIKQHLAEPGYFEPTPEWDKERSWDRLWS